jgi:hypothetical protein
LIPLTEFVGMLRQAFDRRLAEQTDLMMRERPTDFESYLVTWAIRKGLDEGRELIAETIKKVYGE